MTASGVKRLHPTSRVYGEAAGVNADLLYERGGHLKRDSEFPAVRGTRSSGRSMISDRVLCSRVRMSCVEPGSYTDA